MNVSSNIFQRVYGDALPRAQGCNEVTMFDSFGQTLAGSKLMRTIDGMARLHGIACRTDAAGGIALARELQKVSAIVALQPLVDLTSFTQFPGAPDQPMPFMESYVWKQATASKGKTSHSYRNHGEAADIQIALGGTLPVVPFISQCGWGLDEMARATLGNIPLPAMKLQASMRAIMEDANNANYFGDSNLGLIGFYSQTAVNGVQPVTVVAGAAGTTPWSTKTPEEIEADCIEIFTTHVNSIKNVGFLFANRLKLSPQSYMILATTKRSQNTDTTLLQAVQLMGESIAADFKIEKAFECNSNALGGGSADRWMSLYKADPEVSGRVVAQEPAFLPPDVDGIDTTMFAHTQIGGLRLSFPVAIEQRFGI